MDAIVMYTVRFVSLAITTAYLIFFKRENSIGIIQALEKKCVA